MRPVTWARWTISRLGLDPGVLPESLRDPVRTHWDRFVAAGASPPLQQTLLDAGLARVFAASDFVGESVTRVPSLFDELPLSRLTAAAPPGEIAAQVRHALDGCEDELALHAALRRVRRREMVRIAWRDLAGTAGLDETLSDLSDLADACIDAALARLADWHSRKHGTVRDAAGQPQSLVVLGFGKLGARELNFSSDVDLVFAWPHSGESDGDRPLDSEAWFTRLGQKLIRSLNEPTEDGFVFRVDMRLRPFGASGPLATSFAALEHYYQSHGRDWERYALIKARPVAGDIDAGEKLLRELRPFVYRRYLDFNAFESLRDMKTMIAEEVARQGLEDNIKLGRGGIREIEFIGQLFQLIRGGREATLRQRGIRPVLRALAQSDYLQRDDAGALDEAYVFLRRTENRLQMAADRQTHELPAESGGRIRLAWSMGFDDWDTFRTALDVHRDKVRSVFDQVFAAPEASAPQQSEAPAVWQTVTAGEDALPALTELGFGASAVAALRDLQAAGPIQALGARGRRRLDQLMPRLIQAAAVSGKPDAVLLSLLRLVEAVAGRTAYLALLAENDNVLRHLAAITAASPWLLQLVTRVPLLMDELIDPRLFQAAPEVAELAAELDTVLAGVDPADQEAEMDALRQFQQAAVLRIAAADLSGHAGAPLVSQRLTALAEVVLNSVLRLTRGRLQARHGAPMSHINGEERPAELAVIGYGTLGGGELGYGSDLDLVFIHDSCGEAQRTDGPQPLDNAVFFSRWSQRMISFLSTATSAGVLYRVDMRLRPSGSAGLLVSGFDGFARYQREQAWTWEHQALVRARPVAGDADLVARFDALRRDVLCQPREAEALRQDVTTMRERMRRELLVETRSGFDLKQGAGGLIDIEFLVQYWVLLHAHKHAELIEPRGNLGMLAALSDAGLIEAGVAADLAAAYRALLARSHRLTLEGWGTVVAEGEFGDVHEMVRARWQDALL
ncbi:MAG TPA: bifunctional [glutamate--ammonia ligase]-adenylyl-L-tyrosine phosphorylase/[glutamate--ammonia-ligase] adenylyltransferase [Gammaproteobacteria bacterium]|nr:bifunctional [glutamate--ammonia ligase]-adenylyl-L-tyrosine phosphorylase/[glutamate--ammonia-ligase] adenylyltransferase [Gammaproteobacteria bacterium]